MASGAVDAMGAFASTELPELPDLVVDVELEEGAQVPRYPSTGRGCMVLASNRDVCIRANEEVVVSTGVAFHMPYMLVGMITDGGFLASTDVRTDIVDFDTSAEFVHVRLIYRPPPELAESQPMLPISRGQPLAMLTVLPIGRPSLRAVRLVEGEDAEGEDAEGEGAEGEGAEGAPRAARVRQDEAQQVHKILTEQALGEEPPAPAPGPTQA